MGCTSIFFCQRYPSAAAPAADRAAGCHWSRQQVAPEQISFGGGCMSITAYLDGFDADLETKQVLCVALEKTRVSLGLADNFANGIIAKRLIELAKAGEHNPDLLCRGAIEQLRGFLFGD